MKRTLLILIAAVLVFASACRPEAVDTPLASVTAEAPERTLPPPADTVSPEPIRIWTTSRASYHPLRETDFHNRAIDRLVYEPLFDFTPDGIFHGVLAESVSWSEDGLTLTCTLEPDRTFSNGQTVTVADAVASLQTYVAANRTVSPEPVPDEPAEQGGGGLLDAAAGAPDEAGIPDDAGWTEAEASAEAEKPYAYGSRLDVLNAIAAVAADADGAVAIRFSRHYDNAAEYLICPILPARDAGSLYAPAAPGSGRYRLTEAGDGYLAEPVSPANGIALQVRVLDSIGDAMKQFQDGELDLLLLDPNQYALYSGRQNVRFQGFPVNAYAYLRMDVHNGYLAFDANRDTFLTILNWQQKLVSHATFPHTQNALPTGRDDRRLPFFGGQAVYQGEYPRLPVTDAELTLVSGQSTFDAELSENLRLLFERFGYHIRLIAATEDNPNPPGDLRLVTHAFSGYPDPYAFVTEADGGRYRGVMAAFPEETARLEEGRRLLDRLPGDDTADFTYGQKTAYADAVHALTAQLPIYGLAVPSAGIAYGARVEGQLKTAYESPYAGLEDLVVWPIP